MSAKPPTATAAALTLACAVALSACTADQAPGSRTRAAAQAAAATASAGEAPGTGRPTANDGKLIAVYEPGTTPAGEKTRGFLEKNHVLDDVASQANARVKLAHDVPLMGLNCDESNAYWSPMRQDIRYCYEFEDSTRKLFEKPDDDGKKPTSKDVDDDIVGFTNGVVLHELGHALISMYELPVTGKEEDAVDQLAVVLLTTGDQPHDKYVAETIYAWARMASEKELNKSASDMLELYSDEHSLSAQRLYNWTCWLYGSNPGGYQGLVESDDNPDGALPSARAGQCEDEYKKISKSWNTLLKPYLKQ